MRLKGWSYFPSEQYDLILNSVYQTIWLVQEMVKGPYQVDLHSLTYDAFMLSLILFMKLVFSLLLRSKKSTLPLERQKP
jgi:hypothetical protein